MRIKVPNATRWLVAITLELALTAAPLFAQQPPQPPAAPAAEQTEPVFDDLLAADLYKIYAEVRNVGQLLNTGGAGEIVEPILKLADPGPQFKSIISFLKKNSEVLGSSRLMFAFWRARTDVPEIFVAIEFPNAEDAAKFSPRLETFLPTVLPPVSPSPEPSPSGQSQVNSKAPSPSPEPQLPFLISRSGKLVFISEKSFKLEKLHPRNSKLLFRDQNFRLAHDKFSSEPIFLYFNIGLEEEIQKQPPAQPQTKAESEAAAEAERVKQEEEDARTAEAVAAISNATPEPSPEVIPQVEGQSAVLTAGPSPSPTPNPTKEERAMQVASNQLGQLFDTLGFGETQMPEAVGAALALEGNEYVVRALVIDKPDAKKQPIPFLPQLISGAAYTTEAASVLPEDTEVFVTASIDLMQTFEGMRKAAEVKAKNDAGPRASVYKDGVMIAQSGAKEPDPDVFTQFEKKAGFKIKDELLPALSSEIAVGVSLKTLQVAQAFGVPAAGNTPKRSEKDAPQKTEAPVLPMLLIKVRDRDALRRLMPRVLTGLGIGEANLIAQTEKHGDAEMVNYAGVFAYAFVGDFIVLSDAVTVRHLIDANTNHQTLSGNTVFHNSRRWQSPRTLGQVYVSPKMMEGYQDEVRKQSATMNAELRDFLLSLDPRSEAMTYALANDGTGTQHELHLPKNLILAGVASFSSVTKNPPPEMNEVMASSMLSMIANAESQYKEGAGKGSYGSLLQLIEAKLVGLPEMFERYGYKFEVTETADGFEAVATPREYEKTGKKSFFVDKSGVVRGADHGGGPATSADPPIER